MKYKLLVEKYEKNKQCKSSGRTEQTDSSSEKYKRKNQNHRNIQNACSPRDLDSKEDEIQDWVLDYDPFGYM